MEKIDRALFFETLRVMIIEDDEGMQNAMRYLVREMGVKDIRHATDGQKAIEKFQSEPGWEPSVIICDLHMEGMDGLEFTNLVRRGKADIHSKTPVMIATGDHDSLLHEVAQQIGACSVILKPFTSKDFRQTFVAAAARTL
jgi:two-component system, chemotaxis family, chemotaxis protein CheY